MSIKMFLLLFSGISWTIVYIDCIRIGFKYKTYAIPFWALSLNISWEILHTIVDFQALGATTQVIINGVWALFDLSVLYTFFKYGRKYFPKNVRQIWFYFWASVGIAVSFIFQLAFMKEFGSVLGGGYAAFLQNLLMSILFIGMLVHRNGGEGQSLTIAFGKWAGTLAPTILFGIIGSNAMGGPNIFMLIIGLTIGFFDIVYIVMLWKTKWIENHDIEKKGLF